MWKVSGWMGADSCNWSMRRSRQLSSLHRSPCDDDCLPSHVSLISMAAQTRVNTLQKVTAPTNCCLLCASCRAHLPCQSSKQTQRDAGNALPDEMDILAVAVLCEHLLGMSHGIGASCHGAGSRSGPCLQQSLHSISSDTWAFPGRQKRSSGNVQCQCQCSLNVRAACSGSDVKLLVHQSMPSAELLHS